MAKVQRYQSPPNWPAPPPGWVPPPGWQPDPAWGPPPAGWQFWRLERANPLAWGWAYLASAIWVVVFSGIGLVLATTAGGVTVNGAAAAVGAIVGRGLFAGLFTALIAFNIRSRWGFWVYVLVALGFHLVLVAVGTASRIS